MFDKIILKLDGGIGKCIMGSSMLKSLKQKYPESKLIIVCGYPSVFLRNPNVWRVYPHNSLYFAKDHILNQNTKIFSPEPYLNSQYINKSIHLIEAWCNELGINYTGNKPELFLNYREKDIAKNSIGEGKPSLLLQTHGGADNQVYPVSWLRDMPMKTAQSIVNHLKGNYRIFHLKRDNQLALNDTQPISFENLREMFAFIGAADKVLSIDSCCHHIRKALKRKAVVTWNVKGNSKQLGYESHDNIQPNKNIGDDETIYIDSFMGDFDISRNNA